MFRPPHATDASGDQRKSENAIDALKRTGILVKTSDEHRLLVSPVIEVLLPVEKLQQLLDWFLRQNDPNTTADIGDDGGDDGLTLLVDAAPDAVDSDSPQEKR